MGIPAFLGLQILFITPPGVPRSFALSPGSPLTQPCAEICKSHDYEPGMCCGKQNSHAWGWDGNCELLCGVFLLSCSLCSRCLVLCCRKLLGREACCTENYPQQRHSPPCSCWPLKEAGITEMLWGKARTSSAPLSCTETGAPGVVWNQGAYSPFWLLLSCRDMSVCNSWCASHQRSREWSHQAGMAQGC